MPKERDNQDLPKNVKNNLPEHGQDIYREAHNKALDTYADPNKRNDPSESAEQVAHKVAWTAVKNKFKRDGGEWQEN